MWCFVALLPPADELHFRPDESPRVPRLTLHYVPEQTTCLGSVVMIETPVPDAITDGVKGQLSLEIPRS